MSCSKGNNNRTRPQKHQNRTAFKNDLHDTSKKTKLLKSLEITGVCERCKEIIDWKIKYKKYKPLTAPKKCVACDQKTIKYAYHVLCTKCAVEKHVCSKCNKPIEVLHKSSQEKLDEESKYQSILKNLTERKRRTLLRYLKKQQEGEATPNTNIEACLHCCKLAGLDDVNLDEFDDLSIEGEESPSDIESEIQL